MDFTVISRGGLTQAEFAALVGVSRVTTNLWVRGRMSPHRYTKGKIAVVLDHLQSAITHGELPLKDVPAPRLNAYRAVVKMAAARAKSAPTQAT